MIFLLFAGETFYPAGGWEDFCGAYSTLDGAKSCTRAPSARFWDWAHIVGVDDNKTLRVVATWNRPSVMSKSVSARDVEWVDA